MKAFYKRYLVIALVVAVAYVLIMKSKGRRLDETIEKLAKPDQSVLVFGGSALLTFLTLM